MRSKSNQAPARASVPHLITLQPVKSRNRNRNRNRHRYKEAGTQKGHVLGIGRSPSTGLRPRHTTPHHAMPCLAMP